MKYETTIPFAGFYESLHNQVLDEALEQMFTDRDTGFSTNEDLVAYANDAIDWYKAFVAYAKDYVENFALHFGLELEFQDLDSPREYNFTTDRVFCTITEASLRKVMNAVDKSVLAAVAKRRHTSYDGFISFYNPDVYTWGPVLEWDCNQLGTLLQAMAEDTMGGDFDGWQQYDLMEQSRCNSGIEHILCVAGGVKLERLLRIHDYLEDRKARIEEGEWV